MAKKKELDKETAKIEAIGSAIKDLVGSAGWAEVKKRLIKKVVNLQLITAADLQSAPEGTLTSLIAAKTTAARILLEWLQDVEGTVEQLDGNKDLIESVAEGIVLNID